ncbi:hypothetical protein MNBD_DELTA02-325 [hydrothermal vent metagenome]|uniref:Glycosyltransferase RgtA/B/C/D-like domain-containing protein n=1 Tax=hydrothermal vent metagenome TaxID=652676 RepID=A0A3B0UXP2_9ZZZZ
MNDLFRKINATAEWKVISIIIIATSLLYLGAIHVKPGPNLMEARNLIAARECVIDGHWLVTTMNGEPRLQKPPLPTWITALSMKAFADTNSIYVGRAPNIAIASLMALFIYLLSRHWFTKSFAMTCALITVSSTIMLLEGHSATWDIYTVCFAFGGVWLLYNAILRDKSTEPRQILIYTAGAGLLWGLSFLSKGPITLYSVMLPFLLALLLTKKRQGLRWWIIPVVITAGVLIGSSWWVTMNILHPETMDILRQESQAWHTIHREAFYYYLVFPALIFPWTLPLAGSFILPFIKKKDGTPILSAGKRGDLIFFLVWLALSILLLSVVPEKKYRYSMTAVLPASLAATFFLSALAGRGRTELGRLPGLVRILQTIQVPALSLTLTAAVLYYAKHIGSSTYLLVFVAVPVVLCLILWKKRKSSVEGFIITSVATIILYTFAGAFISHDYYSYRSFYDKEEVDHTAMLTSGRQLYIFKNYLKPVWALRRTARVITRMTVVDNFPALIIVKENHIEEFRLWSETRGFNYREIYRFTYDFTDPPYYLFEFAPADKIVDPSGLSL